MILKEICVYTTSICNSNCLNCNIKNNKVRVDLDFIWFKEKLIPYIHKDSLLVIGNEVSLWKHFDEFGKFVDSGKMNDIKYIVLSNAKEYNKLLKYNFKRFTVSWDGYSSEETRYKGCTNKVNEFASSLKHDQEIRIAYVLNEVNFSNALKDFEFILKFRDSIKSIFVYPYFLIACNLPYFKMDEEFKGMYGFEWLFNKLKDENNKKHFEKILNFLIDNELIKKHTFNSLYNTFFVDKVHLLKIPCSNPFYSVQIDEHGTLRYCPGIYWKQVLINNVYNLNLDEIYNKASSSLIRSIYCDRLTDCGVGCRFHVDAKEFEEGFKIESFKVC